MLDWLKKFAGGASIQNKTGLAKRQLELLAEDFAPLGELSAGISTRLTRFVIDDDGAEVLGELASLANAADKFRLRCSEHFYGLDGVTPRSEFFKTVECTSPCFFTRLGRVYDSVTQVHRRLHRIFGDPKLDWLEILLLEATQFSMNVWPRRCRACPAMTADMVEAILEANSFPRELLIEAAFQPDLQKFAGLDAETLFLSLKGLGQSAVRHRQAVLSALGSPDFKQRLHALGMLKRSEVEVAQFQDKIVELSVDSSKQVRELAASLLEEVKTTTRPLIEGKVLLGSNEERPLAVTLLWTCYGEDARPFLETRLKEEKNKKVIRAIEDALAIASVELAQQPVESAVELTPLPPVPSHAPLGADTERAWQECFQNVNAAIARFNSGLASQPHHLVAKQVAADAVRRSFALIQNGGKNEDLLKELFHVSWKRELSDPIRSFWGRPELSLIHLVRFLILVGALRGDRQRDYEVFWSGYWLEPLMPLFRRAHPEAGLRELGSAFTVAGLDARRIGAGILQNYQEKPAPLGLPPERIWPYWAENLDLLEQAFKPSIGGSMNRFYQRSARRNAFYAISAFPQPPARLVPQLWKLALGGKGERLAAQRCLEALPDKVERLINSLTAPEAESRLAAAEWLGRIGNPQAAEPLLTAMKREKNESAKGAMMSALELLGLPVEQFLDRKALLSEAEKGTGKGVPEGLKWFPFDQLPAVHWSDNDEPLAPSITKWWLIQGFKLKNPQPGPLLRKYCSSLKPAERDALGQFVLEAWLGEDTSPITRAEAEKRALQQAQQYVQWSQSSYWPANSPKKTLEGFYADFLPGLQLQPKGSGIASKGVLSVAAVFLSWETVLTEARDPACGHNLVIHEFAHQLDFLDGYTNGAPALRSRDQTQRWQRVMQGTFQRLRRALQQGHKTFLGSYAGTNPTEFFSVASEKLFSQPGQLREHHPELFDVLAEYYRADPLRWFEGTPSPNLCANFQSVTAGTVATEAKAPAAVDEQESEFIDFTCPYCRNSVAFPKPDAGKLRECPNCLEAMIVPDEPGRQAERIPFPIRTDHLVLRRFQTLDAKDLAALMSDSSTLRYLAWNSMSLEDAEEWIASQSRLRFPKPEGYCYFAIEATQPAKVIGMATFWFVPQEFNLAQFEIIIHPDWQRKGYATEAVRGLLAYAFNGLRARRVVADCDARNVAARRLLLKAGLRQESECIKDRFLNREWVNTLGFALLKGEYEPSSDPERNPSTDSQ